MPDRVNRAVRWAVRGPARCSSRSSGTAVTICKSVASGPYLLKRFKTRQNPEICEVSAVVKWPSRITAGALVIIACIQWWIGTAQRYPHMLSHTIAGRYAVNDSVD